MIRSIFILLSDLSTMWLWAVLLTFWTIDHCRLHCKGQSRSTPYAIIQHFRGTCYLFLQGQPMLHENFSDLQLTNWLKSMGTEIYTCHSITGSSAPLNWPGPKLRGSNIGQNGFGMEALNRCRRNYWNRFVMSISANYKVKDWSIR